MDQVQKTPHSCPIHQLEVIAIDMSPLNDNEPRFLCVFCLTSTNKTHKIKPIKDAQNDLTIIKSEFLSKKQEQGSTNSQVLKDLESCIQQFRIYYNSKFDKIIENLKQQQTLIVKEQEDLIVYLQDIDLEQYFSMKNEWANQYMEMKKLIENQINELKNQEKPDKCISLLSKINDTIITLSPEEQSISPQIKEKLQMSTPSLPIPCETHKLEIIRFDLSEQKPKEQRIAYALCAFNKVGQYIDVLSAQKQWQDYETLKSSILESQYNKEKLKIKTAQSELQLILTNYQLKINEVNTKLENNLTLIQKKNQKGIDKMNRDWLNLPRDEIILIADTLSQKQSQQNLKQKDYFHKYQKVVNSLIDGTLNNLLMELHQCSETIKLKENQGYEKDKQDFSRTFNLIKLQVSSNIFTLQCEKKKKLIYNTAVQHQSSKEYIRCITENYFGGSQAILLERNQAEYIKQMNKLQEDSSEIKSQLDQLQLKYKEIEEKKDMENKLHQSKLNELQKESKILEQERNNQISSLNQKIVILEADKQEISRSLQEKVYEVQKEKDVKIEQLNKLKQEQEDGLKNKQIAIEELNRQIQEVELKKQNQKEQLQKQIQDEQQQRDQIISQKDEIILKKQKQIDQFISQVKLLEKEKDQDFKLSQLKLEQQNQQIKQLNLDRHTFSRDLEQQKKDLFEKQVFFSKQQKELEAKLKEQECGIRENKRLIAEQITMILKIKRRCIQSQKQF